MSWKKHKKLAEQLYAQGDYAGAADNYEKAWQKKNSKKELIFKAGESYYLIKDYRKAAEALQNVKDENEEFQLPGLKYARSLKQDGQYKKAGEAFQHFLDNYTGQGKAILEDIIQTEIQGCELGKELPARANRDVEIQLLGGGVNSDEDEFAPFPLGGGGIYFSSSMGGKARIYTLNVREIIGQKPLLPETSLSLVKGISAMVLPLLMAIVFISPFATRIKVGMT